MNSIKKLKTKRKNLYDELYDLHYAEPNQQMYMQRRHEIEYEIACIDDAIEFEKKIVPLKWMLYGFIIVSTIMLIVAFIIKK
jgi:hypothetical protein